MNIYDYFQIVSLVIFLAVFSGRTIWLKRKGTVAFRFGGKKGFPALAFGNLHFRAGFEVSISAGCSDQAVSR